MLVQRKATNSDLYRLYRETNQDYSVRQFEFQKSNRNDGSQVSRSSGKIVLVDTESKIRVQSGQKWIGRVKELDKVMIFTPIQEVEIGSQELIQWNLHEEQGLINPWFTIKEFSGIEYLKKKDFFIRSQDDEDLIKQRLSLEEREDFIRMREIYKQYESRKNLERQQFQEDIKIAQRVAWEYYKSSFSSESQAFEYQEFLDKDKYQYAEMNMWREHGRDFRVLIYQQYSFILNDDNVLLDCIKEFEDIDLKGDIENFKDFRPKSTNIPQGKISEKDKEYGNIKYFREHFEPITIKMDGTITGELKFYPALKLSVSVDTDWGMHEADDPETFYICQYFLDEASQSGLTFKEELDSRIPKAIMDRIKDKIISAKIQEFKSDRIRPGTEVYLCKYIADYQQKSVDTNITGLTFLERKDLLELPVILNQSDESFRSITLSEIDPDETVQLLREKSLSAPERLDVILEHFPVSNYGHLTDEGDILWFGLIVKRDRIIDDVYNGTKQGREYYLSKEIIGKSQFDVIYPSQYSLDLWLDQHAQYFADLWEVQRQYDLPPVQIPEIDKEVQAHLVDLANEEGLTQSYLGWQKSFESNSVLGFDIRLKPDYCHLDIVLNNVYKPVGRGSFDFFEIDKPQAQSVLNEASVNGWILKEDFAEKLKRLVGDQEFKMFNVQIEIKLPSISKEDKFQEMPFTEFVDDPTQRYKIVKIGEKVFEAEYRLQDILNKMELLPQIQGVRWMMEDGMYLKGFAPESHDEDYDSRKYILLEDVPDIKGCFEGDRENFEFVTHELWIITPDGENKLSSRIFARKAMKGNGYVFDISGTGKYEIAEFIRSDGSEKKTFDPRFMRTEWREVTDGKLWSQVKVENGFMPNHVFESSWQKPELLGEVDILDQVFKAKVAKNRYKDVQMSQELGKFILDKKFRDPILALAGSDEKLQEMFAGNYQFWLDYNWTEREVKGKVVKTLRSQLFRVASGSEIPASITVIAQYKDPGTQKLNSVKIVSGSLRHVLRKLEKGQMVDYVFYEIANQKKDGSPLSCDLNNYSCFITFDKTEDGSGLKLYKLDK